MADNNTRFITHPATEAALSAYLANPAHALLITGPKGSGRSTIARHISTNLFGDTPLAPDIFENHPNIRILRSIDGKAISIESVRELQHFLSLKIPGKSQGTTRIVVIEEAGLMTTEAQNALLKTLEEPPEGTVLLLTATARDAVLPTIRSRVRQLSIIPPTSKQTSDYFESLGYPAAAIQKTLMISGGLPGLTQALLAHDEDHPLVAATTHARGILQSKTYERLLLVDSLAKQKELCLDILYVLGRMSRMALANAPDTAGRDRWFRVLRATYDTEEQLGRSVQAKLVLTDLMLAI